MFVLHAIWDNAGNVAQGRLRVWAESSTLPLTTTKRTGKQNLPRIHPFALAEEPLRDALSDVVGSLLIGKVRSQLLTLRLPSTSKGPLPSPELILEEPLESKSAEFKWWDVATLPLAPGTALDFLLALPATPPHGVAYGSSLSFWTECAQLALELLSRQSFVPTLHDTQHGRAYTCYAAWDALVSPEDNERLDILVKAMPPVCWSFVPPGDAKASLLRDLVLTFLNQGIDAFVRENIESSTMVPDTYRRSRAKVKPLPEQWLSALTTENAELKASAEELKAFVSTMRGWLDQVKPVESGAPFRTCFRLDPPAEKGEEEGKESEDEQPWSVSFLLQANDDRSLLVPAEKAWKERSGTLTFLKRKFENPQERLLADLAKASRLFPAIEESLQTARPTGVTLSIEQAYKFLRESAPLLEQSGFGVLVPPWWQKRSARVGVRLKVKPAAADSKTSSGLMGLDSLVSYDWNVAVGDTVLTPNEFERLVKLKQPLVHLRGQWVELRPEEIEAAIAFFKKKHARKNMSLGEALRISLGAQTPEVGLPITELEAEGWIKDVMDNLSQDVKLSSIKVPETFHGTLRPYQLKGTSWLAFLKQFGFGACLADSMGLGKTIQLIALLLHEREMHQMQNGQHPLNPTLLICPMSIVGNWHKEIERFAPSLSAMVHHGAERLSGEEFQAEAKRHDVVITTYSLALRDKEHLGALQWENIVLDEAQNIKNETAKQTQAIKRFNANHKIALTGTPVENRLSELWSIMEFLNPGYLGSGDDFRKTFSIPIERYRNADRLEMLRKLIQPFVLRRLKTDKSIISDLPDKVEMKVFCNLTQEQASLYEAVVKEMVEKIEEAETNGDTMARRGLILAALMKLKQVCNHPAHFMSDGSSLPRRSGKLERLEEMLEEVLAEGDKALIFTQFAEMGTLLRQYLQERLDCEVLFLHGGTPKKQRDMMVQRFQEERRGAPIFILSLKAGGVGLNLTAANHVFHFDRWWNPAVENQATDRAFRIGQRKDVQVHKFVCVGTLEERIDQMIEQKKELAENIVGAGEGWLTEMSTTQLKELFKLGQEAVTV